MTLDDLRFPVGKFVTPSSLSHEDVSTWIGIITVFPEEIKELTQNLSNNELQWKYRPGGWMIKQVVHHCADSHLNSLMRFKLCLTEERPIIKPYKEEKWAELIDSLENDISNSLLLIKTIHHRWVLILNSLSDDDLKRELIHPEYNQTFQLFEVIANYAWHCEHHLAHVKQALNYKGEFPI